MTVPSPATEPSVSQPYSAAANQTSTCHLVVVSTILTVALRCPSDTRDTSDTSYDFRCFSDLHKCISVIRQTLKQVDLIPRFGILSPPPVGKKPAFSTACKTINHCIIALLICKRGEVVKGPEQFFSRVWKSASHPYLKIRIPYCHRCLAPKGGVISPPKLIAKPP